MTRRLLLPALVALVLPATADAKKATLSITKLSGIPASAQAGDTFTIRGRITARKARAKRVAVAATLRGGGSSRAIATKRVLRRLKPGKRRVFRLAAGIPARGVGAGSYRVRICARSGRARKPRCTSRPLTVAATYVDPAPTATPTATPTASTTATPTATATATPGGIGAETAGDRLFPKLGNGGYDAQGYDLALTYVPLTDQLGGTATMTALATQDLTRFSLDFQGFTVSSVLVDGAAATFERVAEAGALGAKKLRVTPAAPIGSGDSFVVVVAYSGSPPTVTDPDGSIEGFLATTDGAFVVGEPMGSMGWFPGNNHPSDKATFKLAMTVPSALEVVGNGVLTSETASGLSKTYVWTETHPMATYLATATLGSFTVTESTVAGLDYYDAAETLPGPGVAQQPAMVAAFEPLFGAYPFDNFGSIVDNAIPPFTPLNAYALETQTKPVYPTIAAAGVGTVSHELAHQWYGNSVGPAAWEHIWLNEGFAEWGSWFYEGDNAANYTSAYANGPGAFWSVPPAAPPTASDIFNFDAMYTRGAATLEALRQIVGDPAFGDIMRSWATTKQYGIATTAEFIALVKTKTDKPDARLDEFFKDWLYDPDKPAITPATF